MPQSWLANARRPCWTMLVGGMSLVMVKRMDQSIFSTYRSINMPLDFVRKESSMLAFVPVHFWYKDIRPLRTLWFELFQTPGAGFIIHSGSKVFTLFEGVRRRVSSLDDTLWQWDDQGYVWNRQVNIITMCESALSQEKDVRMVGLLLLSSGGLKEVRIRQLVGVWWMRSVGRCVRGCFQISHHHQF